MVAGDPDRIMGSQCQAVPNSCDGADIIQFDAAIRCHQHLYRQQTTWTPYSMASSQARSSTAGSWQFGMGHRPSQCGVWITGDVQHRNFMPAHYRGLAPLRQANARCRLPQVSLHCEVDATVRVNNILDQQQRLVPMSPVWQGGTSLLGAMKASTWALALTVYRPQPR